VLDTRTNERGPRQGGPRTNPVVLETKEVIVDILALISVVLAAIALGFTIGNSSRR
jgi:hypothetical protein